MSEGIIIYEASLPALPAAARALFQLIAQQLQASCQLPLSVSYRGGVAAPGRLQAQTLLKEPALLIFPTQHHSEHSPICQLSYQGDMIWLKPSYPPALFPLNDPEVVQQLVRCVRQRITKYFYVS